MNENHQLKVGRYYGILNSVDNGTEANSYCNVPIIVVKQEALSSMIFGREVNQLIVNIPVLKGLLRASIKAEKHLQS